MSEPPEVVRRRIRVSGRVQGVWFRDSCRREALARSVMGWVRNSDDGNVEAAFEGAPSAVGAMIAWCRTGPPHASVTSVETLEEPPIGEKAFRIL